MVSSIPYVVGYAKNDLVEGNAALAPQFVSISDDGISINDIVFDAADMYDLSFQTLDATGGGAQMWMWNDYTIPDPQDPESFIGFWDDGSGEISTKRLAPGEGLWVGGKLGDNMQTAGQVSTSDVIVNFTEDGNMLIANTFPLPVSINDLVFTAADLYDVSLQTLDATGGGAQMWMWNDYTIPDPQDPESFIGFWDDGSGEISSYEIPAGVALWIGAKAGDSVRIPAPTSEL